MTETEVIRVALRFAAAVAAMVVIVLAGFGAVLVVQAFRDRIDD